MKLQLSDSTIRLRLSEEEVRQFALAGQLTQCLYIGAEPGQGLRYTLARRPTAEGSNELRAHFGAGELVVEVPAAEAEAWASGGNISLKSRVVGSDGQELRILVERDLGPSH